MKNMVFALISKEEGHELLLEFYKIWFASRNIKDILNEDKHLALPSFKDCVNNIHSLSSTLAQREIFDFIKEKLDCEEIVLADDKNKILVNAQYEEEDDEEEDYYDEDEDDDDEDDEDEDE